MDPSLFKTIYVAASGIAALGFAVMALGPTRAVRENKAARLISLGGVIIFGGLMLRTVHVVNFVIVVVLIVASQVPIQIGVRMMNRARREEAARAQSSESGSARS
jgi:hypothetical protein